MPIANTGPDGGPNELIARGPLLKVNIGYHPSTPVSDKRAAKVLEYEWDALVDTGASTSCIDVEIADILGLPIVDRKPMGGVFGFEMANIHLGLLNVTALGHTSVGMFCALPLGEVLGVRAILGREFLSHYSMHYDGRIGRVTITNETAS